MVEQEKLDRVFQCLADPTRRDILRRVSDEELSVSEIAHAYHRHMSLAAVSKHLKVLEGAQLITKRREGKQQFIALSPPRLHDASRYLEQYKELWEERLDSLENYLRKSKTK